MAAHSRGDDVPAIRLFRPLAEKGTPKAQGVFEKMSARGQGGARNSTRRSSARRRTK
jgi:hypothetical protein